jgi:Fe-Mn family superoxide dismutase
MSPTRTRSSTSSGSWPRTERRRRPNTPNSSAAWAGSSTACGCTSSTSGTSAALDPASKLGRGIAEHYGDVESWEKDFRATAAMRGIGWVVLYEDTTNGRLINFWINEHDVSHPAGCVPLLVLDVFEHAFMPDYGLKRADYIEAFFKAIDWAAAGMRLK